MWERFFAEGSPVEISQMLLLVVGMGFAAMIPAVWVAGRIVALNARPQKRAVWTTAIGYVFAFLLFLFGSEGFISPWLAPLVPLPGAVIIFLWLRNTYRKGWVEDHEIVEGMSIENSDWRVGVGIVVAAVIAAAVKVAFIRL